MNDTPDGPSKAPHYPTEMELAAYNEAGHAIVGVFQGRYIEYIQLERGGEQWGGEIKQDLDFQPHRMPTLPPREFYKRVDYPVPEGGRFFQPWENCLLKLAGRVAEELLCERYGTNSSDMRLGQVDIIEAEIWARKQFPNNPQKQRDLMDYMRTIARRILSDPNSWYAVETLVQKLVEEHKEKTMMSGDDAHKIIDQSFANE